VLWLLNSSKQIQEAVGGYFKDPTGTSKLVGSGLTGSGDSFTLTKDNMDKLKEELENSIQKLDAFDKFKDQIEMTVTEEGLRIEMMESQVGTFFPSGVSEPNDSGRELLIRLAEELAKIPNKLSIEGHTDATPFARGGDYGNWELSSDRANAARRLMQKSGLRADQVTQVRGFADQHLRNNKDPEDPANRRISLIVQRLPRPVGETPPPAAPGAPSAQGPAPHAAATPAAPGVPALTAPAPAAPASPPPTQQAPPAHGGK
jgi:chemotaxis protein MotB